MCRVEKNAEKTDAADAMQYADGRNSKRPFHWDFNFNFYFYDVVVKVALCLIFGVKFLK